MLLRSMIAAPVILAIILGTGSPAFSQAPRRPVTTAATTAPSDRAKQWLTLVDDKNYTQSWNDAGAAFKTRQKIEDWSKSAAAMRAPLGAMASRDLKSIDTSSGTTAVIRFDSVFAQKAAAIETVTLSFLNGGWSVTNYAVQ